MKTNLGDEEGLNVDMAPLIDCVFLLLIFFLVATTLKKIDEELPIELPESRASLDVKQPPEYTVLGIDREGGLYLDGTPVPTGMMREKIESLATSDTEHKVRLDIDQDVPFRHVMPVLDELRFAGLGNTGINTRHVEEGSEYSRR